MASSSSVISSAPNTSWLSQLAYETVQVGDKKVLLPQTFKDDDEDTKKQYIIHVSSDTLVNYPGIDPIAAFATLSQRANAEVVAMNLRLNFFELFESIWKNPSNLRALGFHSLDGSRIDDATRTTNDQLLVDVGDPISDIPLASRRPEGIAFFEFECLANFDPLVDARHRPCHLRFRGHLQLRQGSVAVTAGGTATQLRTFL